MEKNTKRYVLVDVEELRAMVKVLVSLKMQLVQLEVSSASSDAEVLQQLKDITTYTDERRLKAKMISENKEDSSVHAEEGNADSAFANPEIKMFRSAELPDIESYEGVRVEIEGWEVKDMKSYYDPNTGERVSEPIMGKVVKLVTKPLGKGTKGDGSEFYIRGSALFSLKKGSDDDYGLSSHPRSNIQKFFAKLKIDSLQESVGKMVTVTVDNGFLKIVY